MKNMWQPKKLPLTYDVETKKILKLVTNARANLAELKGLAETIPNQNILINAITWNESKESSAVENIITTHDELYKSQLHFKTFKSLQAKEVENYHKALKIGYSLIREEQIIRNKTILEVHKILEGNDAGFRTQAGTNLINDNTNEIIYTPPQLKKQISELMNNLEKYINEDENDHLDPLISMAIIHHQFESIHPFFDGNGRCGRILNVLYLVKKGLLDLPILYLSNYIIKNKRSYYQKLQKVRDSESLETWEDWIEFILLGVIETSKETQALIKEIREQIIIMKNRLRSNYNFYSQELLNNLFKYPYTKIEFLQQDLKITRKTAAGYLNKLAEDKVIRKEKFGTANFYINEDLFKVLTKKSNQ